METMGSYLMEPNVQWMPKEWLVCDSSKKKEKKCFWRMEPGWGMTCLTCYNLKKVVKWAEPIEAKAKDGAPVSGVSETTVVNVLKDILLELKEL